MVIFGGAAGSTLFNDVWLFRLNPDRQSGTWTRLDTTGQQPGPRRRHGMGIVGNQLFVFGGIDSSVTSVDEFFQLDLVSRVWTKIAATPAPSARASVASTGLDGDRSGYYMYGGVQASDRGVVSELWYYSDVQGSWELLSSGTTSDTGLTPHGLSSATLVATQLDGLLVFGGLTSEAGIISSLLWRYSLFSGQWDRLFNVDSLSPEGRLDHAAAIFADPTAPWLPISQGSETTRPRMRMAVFGGTSRTGTLNEFWLYGIPPVEQISVDYFVCELKQEFVDHTGLVKTDVAAGVYLAEDRGDHYINSTNL